MLLTVTTLVRPNTIQIKKKTELQWYVLSFKADKKPALVMPLQSESYPEASSNLDDQLFIKWTKETRPLEISSSAFFISWFLRWL